MDLEAFKASLSVDAPANGLSRPLQALWHQAKGDWVRHTGWPNHRRVVMAHGCTPSCIEWKAATPTRFIGIVGLASPFHLHRWMKNGKRLSRHSYKTDLWVFRSSGDDGAPDH